MLSQNLFVSHPIKHKIHELSATPFNLEFGLPRYLINFSNAFLVTIYVLMCL
jgi:hypothetical protein